MNLPKILVVDDVADNRELICRFLKHTPCEILEACDGDEALHIIETQSIDLILLDIMMPGIDGFEVLRRARMQFSSNELPILMVTARTASEDVAKALSLGANDYLSKPIDAAVLRARVSSQIERSNSANALNRKVAELLAVNEQLEQEILARKKLEEANHYKTFHDQLTGLGNWLYLEDRLDRQVRTAKQAGTFLASIIIDIAGFNLINETFGHAAGDAVLIDLSRHLKSVAGENSVAARIGSNRFILTVGGYETQQAAASGGEKIVMQLQNSAENDRNCPDYTMFFGLALGPPDGSNANHLIEAAESALSDCRSDTDTHFRFYDRKTDELIKKKRLQKEKLREAIKNNELSVHYQPVADAQTLEVVGFEALVRWLDKDGQWIQPSEFIPLAEEDNLICEIGKWVMQQACSKAASSFPNLKMAVNVSPSQFSQDDFIETVFQILQDTGLTPENLELELTENILIDKSFDPISKLYQLKRLGVMLCLDDFGTGYSSLSYLSDFPVDKIKIDQSFIRQLFSEQSSQEIVSAIINLGERLQKTVTVEGIETQKQLDWIQRTTCNQFQGYFFSKPLNLDDENSDEDCSLFYQKYFQTQTRLSA